MKNLAMIACISKDGGLGKGNELLWHIPEDMKFFKEQTMGGAIVMGRKTFDSIGRALPGRENLVLSRTGVDSEGVKCFRDKLELDKYLESINGKKFIIGGSSLYEMYLPEVEVLYLTQVGAVRPADVYFPKFDETEFDACEVKHGEYDGNKYRILEYRRRSSANE